MPPVKGKSGLMAKYGANLDKAVQAHAADETDYGFMRLPPGINNGIAQLTVCKFDTYKTGDNTGEFYCQMRGVVIEPKSITKDGQVIPVAGRQTMLMEPVCNTQTRDKKVTTQEEHVVNILNEFRKLAGEEFTRGATGADLESLADQLQQAAPYFRFSTSQSGPTPQYPDPKVWENWHGSKGLEEYTPPDDGEGMVDRTGPSNNGDSGGGAQAASTGGGSDFQVMELLEQANAGDEGAAEQLRQMALDTGVPEEDVNAAEDWQAVVDLIAAKASAEDAGTEGAPAEAWEPNKGDVYLYKPIDPKTKKPVVDPRTKKAKGVEVEVTAVDKKTKTVTLKNIDDRKTVYAKVAWDALEEAPA